MKVAGMLYEEVLRDLALYRRHAQSSESAAALRGDLNTVLDALAEAAARIANMCEDVQESTRRLAITEAALDALCSRMRRHEDDARKATSAAARATRALERVKAEPSSNRVANAAQKLGRLGGRKGGKARAERLSPERRREIAQKAAQKRWGNRPSHE